MSDSRQCFFTLGDCDGGTIYDDGAVGCGYWLDGACTWLDDLHGRDARDFYNELLIEAAQELSD